MFSIPGNSNFKRLKYDYDSMLDELVLHISNITGGEVNIPKSDFDTLLTDPDVTNIPSITNTGLTLDELRLILFQLPIKNWTNVGFAGEIAPLNSLFRHTNGATVHDFGVPSPPDLRITMNSENGNVELQGSTALDSNYKLQAISLVFNSANNNVYEWKNDTFPELTSSGERVSWALSSNGTLTTSQLYIANAINYNEWSHMSLKDEIYTILTMNSDSSGNRPSLNELSNNIQIVLRDDFDNITNTYRLNPDSNINVEKELKIYMS